MNAVDLLLIVCFVPALVLGLQKGFVRQAMGLVALVVGIWFSWNFSEPLSIWLLKYFDISPTYMDVIVLGLVFALIKTAIIVGVLIVLFHALNLKVHLVKPAVLDGSFLYTGLKDLTCQVFPFFKKLLLP